MARTATGSEVLEQAQRALREAKTVEELRQAQAVVLPLLLGLSIEQTAAALGVSVGWACQLRRRFITAGHLVQRTRPAQGPRAYLSRAEEEALLEPFVERARQGQIVVAAEIRAALEQRLGKRTAPSTVYLLAAPPRLAKARTRSGASAGQSAGAAAVEKKGCPENWLSCRPGPGAA